jgi:hypothetical protein
LKFLINGVKKIKCGNFLKYPDTIKENTEALMVASKEIGLEVNADKVHGHVSRSECSTKSQYEH